MPDRDWMDEVFADIVEGEWQGFLADMEHYEPGLPLTQDRMLRAIDALEAQQMVWTSGDDR